MLTAYWGSGSPPAWRMLLCLEEKGLPYKSEMITFESKVLQTPRMLQVSSNTANPVAILTHLK